jgi:hypothetical protein
MDCIENTISNTSSIAVLALCYYDVLLSSGNVINLLLLSSRQRHNTIYIWKFKDRFVAENLKYLLIFGTSVNISIIFRNFVSSSNIAVTISF